MKFKSFGVLLFLSLSGFRDSIPALNLPKKNLNICYVSLNNKKEFELMKGFVDKIQSRLGGKTYFNVVEFQEQGKSPEDTFKKMVWRSKFFVAARLPYPRGRKRSRRHQ